MLLTKPAKVPVWTKRELSEYDKMQIMARDYHFEYIQMVGYEERRPKINPRHKKRKRSDLESLLKRQLRHHQHNHRHRHHQYNRNNVKAPVN